MYCVVENNVVVNIVIADEAFAALLNLVKWEEGVKIGDRYENNAFLKAPENA